MIKHLENLETGLLEVAARSAPWLVPILPAYTVGNALHEHLQVWPAVAITGGVAFELVGIASSKNALRCWAWNSTRRKSDPAAPFGLAVALSLIYFATGISLSVLLEVWPALTVFAPASYFVLAGSSYFVLAIGNNLSRWTRDREAEKADRELSQMVKNLSSERDNLRDIVADLKDKLGQAKETIKALEARTNNGNVGQNETFGPHNLDNAHQAKEDKVTARRQEVLSLLSDGLDKTEIADHLNVSPKTISRDIKALNGKVQS